jgi:hypothetical protein
MLLFYVTTMKSKHIDNRKGMVSDLVRSISNVLESVGNAANNIAKKGSRRRLRKGIRHERRQFNGKWDRFMAGWNPGYSLQDILEDTYSRTFE